MKYINSYHNFIVENLDMAKSIMRKKGEDFERIKTLLGKNIGYIGKFTEYLYHENIPYSDLEKLYKDLLFIKSKASAFDIQGFKYEPLIDKIEQTKNNITIKSLIDQFPSEQKNIIRDRLNSDQYDTDTIKNSILKVCNKENVQAFLSKISRYKDFDSLYSAIKIFGKDAKNKKELVLRYVDSSPTANVVYDKGNYLIIKIDNIEDVKYLGSDTSWCILGEHMWKYYTKGRHQYILYNYNKEEYDVDFKIGFTLERSGSIHTAHDVLDKYSVSELRAILTELDIKTIDLFPRIESPLSDEEIDKINYRTSLDKISDFIDRCEKDKIFKFINKLISVFVKVRGETRGHKIKSRICTLLKLYYGDEIIYENDLISINAELMNWIYVEKLSYKIVFNKPVYHEEFSDEVLIKNLINWTDKDFAAMSNITFYKDFRNRKDNVLEIIFNKLDSAYKNPKITLANTVGSLDKNYTKSYKGYRLAYPFELVYLLFGLKLGKDIEDKNKIIEHLPQGELDELVDYIDVPIDLNFISSWRPNLSDNVIKNIIKKDYNEDISKNKYASISIDVGNYKKCLKLIDHLQGYRISFKITKQSLAKVKSSYGVGSGWEDSIIMRILSKFKTKLVKNTTVSEDNVSIRVY